MEYADGTRYDGPWVAGLREGEDGVLEVPSEDSPSRLIYRGQWRADKWHGKGAIRIDSSRTLEAQWKQGKLGGKGKLRGDTSGTVPVSC